MSRRKKLPPEPFKVEIQSLPENSRGAASHDDKPLQVNGALNRLMVHQALELLEPQVRDRALDLFYSLVAFSVVTFIVLSGHYAEE